jgi:hypothetical protein
MDWQQLSALTIVATTAALMIRRSIGRRKRIPGGCGGNCGCAGLQLPPQKNILEHPQTKEFHHG